MARKEITCCPYCGSSSGVYILVDYLQIKESYAFDGYPLSKPISIQARAKKRSESKTVYCRKCNKPIAHTRIMRKQWGEGIFRLNDSKDGGGEDEN